LQQVWFDMSFAVLLCVQICQGCYSTEAARVASGAKSRLPGTLALTDLTLQQVPALTLTTDNDTDMGSEFFETRQAFLSLCQGNHYQVQLG
jgi:hypothetical protein